MLDKMQEYSWPGNVRELKNFVERSVLMSLEQQVNIPDIPGFVANVPNLAFERAPEAFAAEDEGKSFARLIEEGVSISQYLDEKEYALLKWAQQTYGSTYKMAEALGTSQAGIMRRKKKYGL